MADLLGSLFGDGGDTEKDEEKNDEAKNDEKGEVNAREASLQPSSFEPKVTALALAHEDAGVQFEALDNKNINHILWKWFQGQRVRKLVALSEKRVLARSMTNHDDHPISKVHGFDYFSKKSVVPKETQDYIDSFSEDQIEQVKLIQSHVRFWLAIRKSLRRSNQPTTHMSIQVVQSAIRKYLAQQRFIKHLLNQRERDKKFAQFCDLMKQKPDKSRSKDSYPSSYHQNYPLTIYMYSRQKGDKSKRRIFIDDATWTKLCWKVNPYQKKSFELRKIYGIEKGASGMFYTAEPHQKSLCCHLLGKGDVMLDFEFESVDLFKQFFEGFSRLIALYNGENSFYIDGFGVPRRSGPSVVEYASSDKPSRGFRSEADENRYRAALGSLKNLYEEWADEYKDEVEEWRQQKKRELQETQRGSLAEREQLAAKEKEEHDEFEAENASMHDTSTQATAISKRNPSISDDSDPALIAAENDHSLSGKVNPLDSAGINMGLWSTNTFATGKVQNSYRSTKYSDEKDKPGFYDSQPISGSKMNDKDVHDAEEMQRLVSKKKIEEDENASIELNEIEIKGTTYLVSYEGGDESNGILYEKKFDENGDEEVGDQVGAIVNDVPTFIKEDDSEVNALFSEKGSGADVEVGNDEKDGDIDIWGAIGGFFGGTSQAAADEEVKEEPEEEEHIFTHEINGFPCFVSDENNGPIYRKISEDEHGEQIGDIVEGSVSWYPGQGPQVPEEDKEPPKKSIFSRMFGGKKAKPGAA